MKLRSDDEDDGGDDGHSCDSPVESTVWTRLMTFCAQNEFLFVNEVFTYYIL